MSMVRAWRISTVLHRPFYLQFSFHEMCAYPMLHALSKSIRQYKKSEGARKMVELVEDKRFVEMSLDVTKDNSVLCRRVWSWKDNVRNLANTLLS